MKISRLMILLPVMLLTLLSGCGAPKPGPELWVIGLDGADWDQIDPMIARGELPNLAQLKKGGASGILLSDNPMISPILWTSISTGKTPDLHGVTWFMTDAPDGSKIPISSEERRVRTFWNIASEAGLSCGITGWWATWPAEPINGYLISDAVAWHSFGVTGRGNPAEGKTWPWDLIHTVNETMPNPASISDELMTRLIHLPARQLDKPTGDSSFDDPISHLRQALATSRGYTDLTLDLMRKQRPQVMSVYYEGTDATSHLFEKYRPPRLPWISQKDFNAYRDVVDEYWKWQDTLIGELLAQRGPLTTILIVSDHGFRQGSERRREDHFHIETADKDHQPDGIVILNGPNIKAGSHLEGARIYDVTPTILYTLGLSVGRDMVGHPLTDAFTTTHLRESPVEWIPTYETSERQRGSAAVQDQQTGKELEKMLRSLGYIAGGEGSAKAVDDGYTSEQIVNLATVLMGQGRADEAVQKLQTVLKEHPGNYDIRLNLAQALYRDHQVAQSEQMYKELIRDFPDRLAVYEDFALARRLDEKFAQAMDIYDQGLAVSDQWINGMAGKALCLAHLGHLEEGEALLRLAQKIDPRSHSVYWNLGLLQQQNGNLPGAVESLRRALEIEPTDAATAVTLAEVQFQRRNLSDARQTLQHTLDKGGDRALLLAELGSLQLRTGKAAPALKTLVEASKLAPENQELLGNLGMAYAMTGSLPSAITTFEKLVALAPERADARGQLGALQAQNGQTRLAVENLRQATLLAPDNPGFHLNLAYALQQTGDLNGAADQFRKVMDLDPSIAQAPFGLGRLELKRGNTAEGHRLIREARKLDPSLPTQ